MEKRKNQIRLALPSKGRLAEEALQLLEAAGLAVYKPNPRQYQAVIPNLPDVQVIFQRASDIVVSVRDGSVDFGITGYDVVAEKRGANGDVLILHQALGFGRCSLNVIVPEALGLMSMADVQAYQAQLQRPLKVATKYKNATSNFFDQSAIKNYELIEAEGTLEIAPTIGYADMIVDLVSTGTTLRDNRLLKLDDGTVLNSQACMIGNKGSLKNSPAVLDIAKMLLEIIVAYLRAKENTAIYANIQGDSPEEISKKMRSTETLRGLQGPTISRVITEQSSNWYAAHLIIKKDQITQAIREIRQIGGSGVVVTPVTYIFEEEPVEYTNMLSALED